MSGLRSRANAGDAAARRKLLAALDRKVSRRLPGSRRRRDMERTRDRVLARWARADLEASRMSGGKG